MTHRTFNTARRAAPGSETVSRVRRKFRRRPSGSAASVFLTLLTLLFSNASTTGAQENSNRPAQPANTQATPPASTDPPGGTETEEAEPTPTPIKLAVTDVYNFRQDRERDVAGLGDIIVVRVSGLRTLLDRAKCASADPKNPPSATCKPQELLLYLDGRPLKGLLPESGAPEPEEGTLRFHLQRPGETAPAQEAADTDEHWADLLGLSTDDLHLHRKIPVSVGLENEYPIDTQVKEFRLLRMRKGRLIFWSIFFILCLVALVHLARKSDLLRDRKPVMWKQRKPYSLSLSQAAWWFVLTSVSFVFIWMVTGDYDLSSSVLVLLGIGFGTALGSVVIDQNKGARPATNAGHSGASELDMLIAKKSEQEARLTTLESNLRDAAPGAATVAARDALAAQQSIYGRLIEEIKQKYPGSIGGGHTNFATDILSDAHGVSFHRFQMLVWTVVLGFIFIHSVFTRLAMPQFNTTLLTLMGISAAAYLGGKGTEGNETGVAVTQPAAPSGGNGGDTPDAAAATGANVPPAATPPPSGGTTATGVAGTTTAGSPAAPAADSADADSADAASADTDATDATDAATTDDTDTTGSETRA